MSSLSAAVGGEGSFEEIESFGKLPLLSPQGRFQAEDARLVEEPVGVSSLAGVPENLGPVWPILDGLGIARDAREAKLLAEVVEKGSEAALIELAAALRALARATGASPTVSGPL